MDYKPNHKNCLLCLDKNVNVFHRDRKRLYLRCENCNFVFVPFEFHLSPEAEKKRYDLHQNSEGDDDYRSFLSLLLKPLLSELPRGAHGLNFGSGPEPVLSLMLMEKGFSVKNYDPFYAHEEKCLGHSFDFIACAEVIEHFRDPKKEWEQLLRLTKKGGWIAIMTTLLHQEVDFTSWYYKGDLTHIGFYSEKTLRWIAENYGIDVNFCSRSVTLFHT